MATLLKTKERSFLALHVVVAVRWGISTYVTMRITHNFPESLRAQKELYKKYAKEHPEDIMSVLQEFIYRNKC